MSMSSGVYKMVRNVDLHVPEKSLNSSPETEEDGYTNSHTRWNNSASQVVSSEKKSWKYYVTTTEPHNSTESPESRN